MEMAIEDLKDHSNMIISEIGQGSDITIILNGKSYAKIIPIAKGGADNDSSDFEDELFGIWKDRSETEIVDQYVRKIRQGRRL